MSNLYSTSLTTQYLDPRTDISNTTTEFRLDRDTAYYPNMMISGLSATMGGGNNRHYSALAGAYGLIRHCRLMDGRIELDSVRYFNRWTAFQNANKPNAYNIDVGGKLSKSINGFSIQDTKVVESAQNQGLYSSLCKTTATHTEKDDAIIDLRVVLPILNNISYLDTSVFKNLKIVIEWEQDVKQVLSVDNDSYSTRPPVLIVDELKDPAVIKSLKSQLNTIVWNSIEHDMIQVPDQTGSTPAAGVSTQEQQVNATINGYDNKFVERVVLIKSLSDKTKNFVANAVQGCGDGSSYAQHKEKIQMRINGKNLFPSDGLVSASQKAMLLHQTWGTMNVPPFANQENIGLDAGVSVNRVGTLDRSTTNGVVNSVNHKVGQYSFVGFSINQRINQLQIDFRRGIIDDSFAIERNNLGLDLHLFAETRRSMSISADNYNVKYL